ncbi:MAG: AAA family ATPase [Candidatus Nanohaloarchaea archaeon]|nr:AAA family ATPase [Candidatus Nanohaloarchaea archaeon]
MGERPEIRRELLGGQLSEDEIDELQQEIDESSDLQRTLKAYNAAAEEAEDQESFYRKKIMQLKQTVDRKKKTQKRSPHIVSMNNMQDDQQHQFSTDKQTPVLRGVVTGEFDGDRIWVEPKSAPKGEYGVQVPNGLTPDDLTVGTEVALDPQNFRVKDILQKSKDPQFSPVETGKTFADVGGLEHVIKSLRRNVGVQLDDDRKQLIEDWGLDLDKAMMLVGPPGTGKTLLVKALANEYEADMLMVNGPQLVEKFIGEGAKKIRSLYEQARSGDRPSIVFIDEIDSIAKKRQANRRHGGEEVERTMSQLLSELDGLDKESGEQNVISIFATNKPSILDPAIVNRCSAIEVDVPDAEAKKEILQVHTRGFELADGIDLDEVVAGMPNDYTGRDIEQICKQAAISALYRVDDISETTVTAEDFEEAIQDLKEGNLGMGKDFIEGEEEIHKEIFA